MKTLRYMIPLFVLLSSLFAACNEDEGNYAYLSEEEIGEIKIDTVGIPNRRILQQNMDPGDTIVFEPNVTYKYPERLRYRWFVIPHPYKLENVGNAQKWPEADTISCAKKLDWIVDLEPGMWRFYLMAEDSITGVKAYYQAQEQYVEVNQSGTQSGLYLLIETADGNTDIGVWGTELQLITDSVQILNYYTGLGKEPIPGKPRFLRGATSGQSAKDAYIVATDKELYRLNKVNMRLMNDWANNFYNVPETFAPQNSNFKSYGSCEYLINDGKLHTLYVNKSNDGLFSAPVAGDYEAASFLWRSGSRYAQIIYDTKNRCFRPYYANNSTIGSFRGTGSSAYVDANKLPANPVAILNSDNYEVYCIVPEEGTRYLYRFNFNDEDKGDFSADGERSKIDLSGCTGIMAAKYYASTKYGTAFYYATDKGVYSFTPSSGSNSSRSIYECKGNETVTAIYVPGTDGGGWPTSSVCFYVALWDEAEQEGSVLEYEMDHYNGVPSLEYSNMFTTYRKENPFVSTGWGKVVDMCWIDAE